MSATLVANAAALLRASPKVTDVASLASGAGHAPALLVLPSMDWLGDALRDATAVSKRALRGWEATYDSAYRKPAETLGPNFAGWISSFDRQPIPLTDMQDWRAGIAARLLNLPHRHVLEIGCGTGLIVDAVAAHCDAYHATDFSSVAVSQVAAWLETRPDLSHVTVARAAAHEVHEDQQFDLVVINSVIQHFPDAAYLQQVLGSAWHMLRPGGNIVIGDVRWLSVLPVFISAVEFAKGGGALDAAGLRHAVLRAWLGQTELVVDPGLFHRFAAEQGGSVHTWLKTSRSTCEMTRYRYDVIIGKPESVVSRAVEAEPTFLRDIGALNSWLANRSSGSAVLRNLPNARLSNDVTTHREIADAPDSARLSMTPHESGTGQGYDPADLADLATAHGLRCVCMAPPRSTEGRFDAWFGKELPAGTPDPPAAAATQASEPLLHHTLRRLSVELHNLLSDALPTEDMPASILPVGGAGWPNLPSAWSEYLISRSL